MDSVDMVNHPSHYTQGGMECIDEMIMVFGEKAVAHFCLCNVWKYRKRALFKNGQEDMDKSNWYMAKYKELVDGIKNDTPTIYLYGEPKLGTFRYADGVEVVSYQDAEV